MLELPQQFGRDRQARHPRCNQRRVQQLSSDHGLAAGLGRSLDGRDKLFVLPQWNGRDRKARQPLRDIASVRHLPPHHGLAADHDIYAQFAQLSGHPCPRAAVPRLPHLKFSDGAVSLPGICAQLRGLPFE